MLQFRGGDSGIFAFWGIFELITVHPLTSLVDCIILWHASAWEKLCKLYVLVVPVKPMGCWTYKGNNYALATFGQVPGLPGTTLMRCSDKLDSLKSKGSFLHFFPLCPYNTMLGIPSSVSAQVETVSSAPITPKEDVERGEYKRKQTPGRKFFTYNSFWQEMSCSFQQNFITTFKTLISLYSNFAFISFYWESRVFFS